MDEASKFQNLLRGMPPDPLDELCPHVTLVALPKIRKLKLREKYKENFDVLSEAGKLVD